MENSSSQEVPLTSAQRVLLIPELLCIIISHLTLSTILLSTRCVNSTWKSVVNTAPSVLSSTFRCPPQPNHKHPVQPFSQFFNIIGCLTWRFTDHYVSWKVRKESARPDMTVDDLVLDGLLSHWIMTEGEEAYLSHRFRMWRFPRLKSSFVTRPAVDALYFERSTRSPYLYDEDNPDEPAEKIRIYKEGVMVESLLQDLCNIWNSASEEEASNHTPYCNVRMWTWTGNEEREERLACDYGDVSNEEGKWIRDNDEVFPKREVPDYYVKPVLQTLEEKTWGEAIEMMEKEVRMRRKEEAEDILWGFMSRESMFVSRYQFSL